MKPLFLHEFHATLNARFGEILGEEIVLGYSDLAAEHHALRDGVGLLDLGFRSRLCLTGADRLRFMHGQVTNDVNALAVGDGCYAALVTAKGKMVSDMNVYRLENELLLDFEPGLTGKVQERLEKYVIAEDVQVVDVAPMYGLLSVQGPRAADLIEGLKLGSELPRKPLSLICVRDEAKGEIYVVNHGRLGGSGFDLFIPNAALSTVAATLQTLADNLGGRWAGWDALELARIEAGQPRFGQDMDESNLPPEAGLESRAISYSKGCYIGQEIIARIRTYGQVARLLRGLRFPGEFPTLPKKGDKLFKEGKEVGFVTSAARSPSLQTTIGLGYVRREANAVGTELELRTEAGARAVYVVDLPFEEKFA